MTNDDVYDFIGELAIALYSKKIRISLGSLRSIMLERGRDYVNNRGMASAVAAAYRRWKEARSSSSGRANRSTLILRA